MSPPASHVRTRLTHAQVEQVRHARGRSMLLFITDRCPVGCEHCSVDSRVDSPTINDFALFESIVTWLCEQSDLQVVGISGGEPFVERRGLTLAAQRVTAAGKDLVIFTSGIWARAEIIPRWIEAILARCACVYLSTDAFHARSLADSQVMRAARAVVAAGAWLVVQVLDHGDSVATAERWLVQALGDTWRDHAEMNVIVPLRSGRGETLFTRIARTPGHAFGPCSLARSPMIRYDGTVTACCNESVIMSRGPERLRLQSSSKRELGDAVATFHRDPLLRVIGDVGLGALTAHPRVRGLGERRFATNCELCWQVIDRMPDRTQPDHLLNAINELTRSPDHE
ncbi:MAG: radical SAM protein [Polyangiales bacterium]